MDPSSSVSAYRRGPQIGSASSSRVRTRSPHPETNHPSSSDPMYDSSTYRKLAILRWRKKRAVSRGLVPPISGHGAPHSVHTKSCGQAEQVATSLIHQAFTGSELSEYRNLAINKWKQKKKLRDSRIPPKTTTSSFQSASTSADCRPNIALEPVINHGLPSTSKYAEVKDVPPHTSTTATPTGCFTTIGVKRTTPLHTNNRNRKSTALHKNPSQNICPMTSRPLHTTHEYRRLAILRWKNKRLQQLKGKKPHEESPSRIHIIPPPCTGSKKSKNHSKSTPAGATKPIRKGRDLLEIIPEIPNILPPVSNCLYCFAKRIVHETDSFCCCRGSVHLAGSTLLTTLKDLLLSHTSESKKYKACIRTYNNHLAFTSFGVSADKELSKRHKGIYTFRVQGQVYHWMNSLTGIDDNSSNLQFYFHDTDYEVSNRIESCPRLFEMTLDKILLVLADNPYARFFRSLRTTPNLEDHEILLYCNPSIDQRVYNKPTVSQVAAIWVDTPTNETPKPRSIQVFTHGGHSRPIQYYFACYDPLQYPILFASGELGWHQGIPKIGITLGIRKRKRNNETIDAIQPQHATDVDELLHREEEALSTRADDAKYVSIREYYSYKFQMRNDDESYLLNSGRLFQQYAVDMYIKLETQRLDFFRLQQDEIRLEFMQGITDAIASGEQECGRIGQRVVLPGTFTWSPRHMRRKYLDAMSLVQKFGKPDLFLTMTCNPNWPEIKEHLLKGELAQDRPDLLTRVFRAKLEELKNEIFKKNIFGQVAAYTYVIEFQKRGLPHVHMLLILKPQYKLFRPEEFDKVVSAELPDKKKFPHLYKLVVKHMLHGPCGELNPGNPCMTKNYTCRSSFPKEFCNETIIGTDAYPLYRRRNDGSNARARGCLLDNRWVVPYNPYLLAKFNCHMNIEICSTIKAVKYIYKYVRKGNDRVLFSLTDKANPTPIDEIEQYRSARWVSPPEALWRIYRFTICEMRPAVINLQVHLENNQPIVFNKKHRLANVAKNPANRKTMLTEYFYMNSHDKNAQALQCTYTEFPDHFVWLANQKGWKLRDRGNSVGRVVTVQPREGERYYLHLLLCKVRCPKSFVDLKTVDGTFYATYNEAALQRGLLQNDNSQEACMTEASLYHMPYELRRLFATLLVYCCPNDPRKLWSIFEDSMSEDILKHSTLPRTQIRKQVLTQINTFLCSMGSNIKQFNIVPPELQYTDLEDLTRDVRAERTITFSEVDLQSRHVLNKEQKHAFDTIIQHVHSNAPGSFFIDGPGGTGKTFLYRALLATVRSEGHIALATATSGIAASLLPGGRTAHSRFKIPIDETSCATCRVSKQSALAMLIKEAKLVIWDEAPMSKRSSIEALDDLLRDLMDSSDIFGGKVVVLGGDFRQTLPVVPRATKKQTIDTSLIKSPLWSRLYKIQLVQNMRAKIDPSFTQFLLDIGNGSYQVSDIEDVILPSNLLLNHTAHDESLAELINLVFPELETNPLQRPACHDRAILTTKNQFVDEINNILIKSFPGCETEYLSFDETENPNDQGQYQDILNSLSPNGLPQHKLIVKPNAPIILLRNIDPSEGLCNGTRLICRRLTKNVIEAEIAVGDMAGKRVFIHRIPLYPANDEYFPVRYKRIQFPIRLCFAMTINKSQGQTMSFAGVYLKEPVFSHGQLYVALSRVRTAATLRVYVNPTFFNRKHKNMTRNVVYKQLLEEANHLPV